MSTTWQRRFVRVGAWFALSVLVCYGMLAALSRDATWLDWLRLAGAIVVYAVIYQVALRCTMAASERVRAP